MSFSNLSLTQLINNISDTDSTINWSIVNDNLVIQITSVAATDKYTLNFDATPNKESLIHWPSITDVVFLLLIELILFYLTLNCTLFNNLAYILIEK